MTIISKTVDKTVKIYAIPTGETFKAQRTKCKEDGYYMKLDKNNVYIDCRSRHNNEFAVNLETGQIRKFQKETSVMPIKMEVNVN